MAKLQHLNNIPVLTTGETLIGKILETTFHIKSSFGGLTVQRNKIVHIHFAGPPGYPIDETQLVTGDRIKGDVTPTKLRFRLEATGQEVAVPIKQIHTAILLSSISD